MNWKFAGFGHAATARPTMGGCASSPEVEATEQDPEYTEKHPATNMDDMQDLKFDIGLAEDQAVEAGPERLTFIASVLRARQNHHEDANIMEEVCVKLQGHNKKLKSFVATADAEAIYEAMNGGFLGLGCNHNKLIAAVCTRTKSQLSTTAKRYRAKYDKDIREEVKGETGGNYGRMMYYALGSRTEYVIDMIDKACEGWGTAEMILIELFITCEQQWLQAGKQAWEGRHDKSLIDYVTAELGSSYSGLCRLLMLLLKGDRAPEFEPANEALAHEQCEQLRGEVDKGMFSSRNEDLWIDIIGTNSIMQNMKLAEVFENKYSQSLRKGMADKMPKKLGWCLSALLMPRQDFIAMRIESAMKGWFTDAGTLCRLLGGLDDRLMAGLLDAYERKYGLPLASALNNEIGGNFAKAAIGWLRVLQDPAGGVEAVTEAAASDFSGDAPKLAVMCDFLLLEHESLMRCAAALDVETLAEATKGITTDDSAFIKTITCRSKRHLGRISYMYREANDKSLSELISANCSDWYAYLAKFLVLQPSQSDALLLDIALEGNIGENDKCALIEFLCARHPRRVRATKKAWEKKNDQSLVDRLSDELNGDLKTIALTMLKGKRMTDDDDAPADAELAKAQAAEIHDDMGKAIEILCSNSNKQNAAINHAYEMEYDMSLGRAIGEEYNGDVKAALTAMLLSPAEWYASRLKASFKGFGTSDRTVCRIIGAHDKDEIKEIAKAYDEKYGRRLKNDIQQECSGDYRRLAVAWVDLPDQLAQPDKQIVLPEPVQDVPEEAKVPFAQDEEDDDDGFEERDEVPPPSSPIYGAKIVLWKQKLEAAEAAGKQRRTAYYRRLLTMYPPLPQGHKILEAYCEALVAEFQKGEEGMVAAWLSSQADEVFEEAGTTKEFFDDWNNTSEDCLRKKLITVGELKHSWGITGRKKVLPTPEPEEYETPYEKPSEAAPPPPPPPNPYQVYQPPVNPMMEMMQAQAQMTAGLMQVQTNMMSTVMTQQQTIMQQTTFMRQPAGFGGGGVQKMAATVPFGVYGGQEMNVQTQYGMMRVTVPPGYGPGSTFYFNVPVPSPFTNFLS